MNERIKELARKAGISILYEYDGYDGHAGVANFDDIEKFAELIVQECVRNYRIKHGEYLRTGQHIDEYEHANNMLTQLGFKKLFGVEE
jgi:hypothetical protein